MAEPVVDLGRSVHCDRRTGWGWEDYFRTAVPVYDNSRDDPAFGEFMKAKTRVKASRSEDFAIGVGRALRRAAKDARKIARMYGTPIYVLRNGRVVAEKP
jgi:hypothetical protein